ncbi:arabinosyltransferase C-terminal domain-containing protein [Hoyosella rhizosphaerae]|uniref:Arabinosyltransferase C-terminal domain-containing protein n=1 Tax=Hoyosella rhizosphaerae TaxID=1755582 RepID=A0A916UCP3_9ACTN|nr:arabinosyltransferase C-terminal domain-containing protein [Hoyosella rhizosphaerae]MBN4925764.1 arabinosyltransferase C-terminal domain-containing protein [Hoyosella rhizosphaerae]GGC68150.1 hypothetical protein GCM10011410_21090 [Hoyosella rhizosphaerae]
MANIWQVNVGGGPLGWIDLLTTSRTLPTYLSHDWESDWGALEQYAPIDPRADQVRLDAETVMRSGWWRPRPSTLFGELTVDNDPLTGRPWWIGPNSRVRG